MKWVSDYTKDPTTPKTRCSTAVENINISFEYLSSQGSQTKRVRCARTYNYSSIVNFMTQCAVKEFWKAVII